MRHTLYSPFEKPLLLPETRNARALQFQLRPQTTIPDPSTCRIHLGDANTILRSVLESTDLWHAQAVQAVEEPK